MNFKSIVLNTLANNNLKNFKNINDDYCILKRSVVGCVLH